MLHSGLPFSLPKRNVEEILKKILNLETSKTCQDTDVSTKTIQENVIILVDVLLSSFNNSVEKSKFHFP